MHPRQTGRGDTRGQNTSRNLEGLRGVSIEVILHVRRRTILLWTIAILLLGAGPLMAYGPLVPWSPIHPGYDELRLARSRVLYPSGTTLPEVYRHIDDWIAEGETFHSMRANKRITIVLCRDWKSVL